MNNYYVIEIQTNADGTSGNIVTGFQDKLVAEAPSTLPSPAPTTAP